MEEIMDFINEKILINYILASGKDYVTFEELHFFRQFYQQQLLKTFINYQEIVQNINEINSYHLMQNYNDGFFITDLIKLHELNLIDDNLTRNINNYFLLLSTIKRYVFFQSKIL